MEWIKIKDRHDLPRDGSIFMALWKGIICIAEHDTEEDRFYISYHPASDGYMRIPQEREAKFTHWMKMPEMPKDY